jgi:5-methylcytosine-specific restriction enzyme subunit McrC
MTTLKLREWTTEPAVRLTSEQRDVLRSVFAALVQPSPGHDDRYDVTPTGIVGAVQVEGTTLVVTPKLPIHRVLFMLGYVAEPGIRPEDADLAVAPDLVSGVTRLFTTLAQRALQRDVLHGYHSVDADLHTIRGRIDLAEQLRRRPGLDLPVAVRFQEHDEDVLENQLLLAATTLLRQSGTRDAGAKRSLHRLAIALQDVSIVRFPPPAVPAVVWTRLNEGVHSVVELARLLLSMQSPDLVGGATRTPGLTIDMAALFETFVRTAMREALGADVRRFPSGKECPPLHLDVQRRVRLEPDLSYWPARRCTFVGDVKYKRDSGSGHNADLYQLLAYATATGLPEATLMYALGASPPRTHTVVGGGIRLHVEHLDLTLPPADLLDQIGDLARRLCGSAVEPVG